VSEHRLLFFVGPVRAVASWWADTGIGARVMDELDDPAKKAGDDNRDLKAHRQARAYKLTQIVLTAAMQQQQLVEEQMGAFLESAPKLAQRCGPAGCH
jgi:hypothetical protein